MRWLLLHEELFSAKTGSEETAEEDDADIAEEPDEDEKRDGYLIYQETESNLSLRLELPEGVTRVGRLNSMDYTLTDPEVSGVHAEITRSPDSRYYIRDISADGETYIDGKRIPDGESVELRPGDKVQMGRTLMEFQRRFSAQAPQFAGITGN